MNFTRVRREVPLSDADFAAIRANVMQAIERPERRFMPIAFRLAFAALAIVIALLMWPKKDGLKPVPHHAAIPPIVASAAPATGEGRPATVRQHHHVKHRKPAPQIALRMEIQTADPDVRIIWISR